MHYDDISRLPDRIRTALGHDAMHYRQHYTSGQNLVVTLDGGFITSADDIRRMLDAGLVSITGGSKGVNFAFTA